jgi:hypothetical protein
MTEHEAPPREGAEEPSGSPLSFEAARERLRARGYLDRGVEGAVLKGALATRTRAQSLLIGAVVGALFLALALALVETVVNTVAGALSLGDSVVLFGWIAAGSVGVAVAAVLLLVGAAFLRVRGRADADGVATEIAAAFGVLAGVGAVAAAVPALREAGPGAAAAVLVALGLAAFVAVRTARGVTLAALVASGRAAFGSPRRLGLAGLAVVLFALAAGALLWVTRREPAAPEPLVVEANTRRAVVVGVDGWSDRYLGQGGAFSASFGAAGARYVKQDRDLAAFWTTVATGESAARHGVGALDLVRLAGVFSPFRPVGVSAFFLGRVLPALGAARRESVTAAARRVPAAWEVARRAGITSLVVNWWTTYPAGDGGGTVLSNHLFFAARSGASLAGEGWPPEAAARAAALAPRAAPPAGSLQRLVADAEGLDAFALRAFRDALVREKPRLSLLYLPGLDILGAALSDPGRSASDRVALAEAVTSEAGKIRDFLEDPAWQAGVDLVVVLFDGGRGERGGLIRLAGPLARPGATATIAPADVAPTVLAALGVPASREAAGKVAAELLQPGAVTSATVASWGVRPRSASPDIDPKAYVENLKSLGYLR